MNEDQDVQECLHNLEDQVHLLQKDQQKILNALKELEPLVEHIHTIRAAGRLSKPLFKGLGKVIWLAASIAAIVTAIFSLRG